MITYDGIVNNIRKLISEKEMKQCVIARRSGYGEKVFSNMLNHRTKIPADALPKIAKALDVDVGVLFDESVGASPSKTA